MRVWNTLFQPIETKCSCIRNKVFPYTKQSVSYKGTLCLLIGKHKTQNSQQLSMNILMGILNLCNNRIPAVITDN